MKKFTVEMSSDYGCDCCGFGYGRNDSSVLNLEEEVAEVLSREIESHGGELTKDAVLELIDNGETCLQAVHDKIEELCVDMDVEYWLGVCYDDDCGALSSHIMEDMENGMFVPEVTFEEFCASYREGEGEDEIVDVDDEDLDEDFLQSEYCEFLCGEEYVSWVQTLSQYGQAERLGLDIGAVMDACNSNYTIRKGE